MGLVKDDMTHADAMEWASSALLDAMHGIKTRKPLGLLDPHRCQTWKPVAQTPLQARRAAELAAEREQWMARRVQRDPCRLCGVRGDIGCEHRP